MWVAGFDMHTIQEFEPTLVCKLTNIKIVNYMLTFCAAKLILFHLKIGANGYIPAKYCHLKRSRHGKVNPV